MSNKIRNLIIAMPKLCGVEQHERWSKMFELLYDHEVADSNSVFARKDGEDFDTRSEVARGIFGVVDDAEKADHIWWLLDVADRAAKGEITPEELAEISEFDGTFPDVDEILKPSEAATILAWSPGVSV